MKKGGLKKTVDMKLKDELRYFRQTEGRRKRGEGDRVVEMKDLWADEPMDTAGSRKIVSKYFSIVLIEDSLTCCFKP